MNGQPDLEGLSALLTGATFGIGKAAAEELGRRGAEIVVHGRNPVRGSAVAGTITAEGGKARFVVADLTDPAQVDHLVDQAGAVDVLVNNAGFSWFSRPRSSMWRPSTGSSPPTSGRHTSWSPPAAEDGHRGQRQHHQPREQGRPDRPGPVAPPTAPPRPP